MFLYLQRRGPGAGAGEGEPPDEQQRQILASFSGWTTLTAHPEAAAAAGAVAGGGGTGAGTAAVPGTVAPPGGAAAAVPGGAALEFALGQLYGPPEERRGISLLRPAAPPLAAASSTETADVVASELTRSRVFSNGVRQRLAAALARSPGFQIDTHDSVTDPMAPLARGGVGVAITVGPAGDTSGRAGVATVVGGDVGDLEASVFCLCPLGHEKITARVFEAAAAGCIPVIIADDVELPFQRYLNWDAFALRVREADYAKLPALLGSFPADRVRRMQRNLHAVGRRLLFDTLAPGGEGTLHGA